MYENIDQGMGIKELKLIGKGREAEVYQIRPEWVVKLYHNKNRSLVAEEARVHRELVHLELPVTSCDGVVEIEGRIGIVLKHIKGTSILRELTIRPWKMVSLAKRLASLHSQIHAKKIEEIPNEHSRLKRRIEEITGLDYAIKSRAINLLKILKESDRICHGDFHPDNILITNKCSRIIDWSNISKGNPLADVARTSLILRLGDTPPGTSLVMKWIIGLGRKTFHSVYLNQYFKLNSDLSRSELHLWGLPIAIDRLSEAIPAERKELIQIIQAYSAEENI